MEGPNPVAPSSVSGTPSSGSRRRNDRKDGKKYIPAVLFSDGEMSKFITGAITVLYDGGFTEEEILAYLFTPDDSLPGRPIDALHGHGAREVIRRAQAMAF